ncbi:MAG: hypothetical protein B6226_04210 [Candidatus Cloacimonetes bacterium 4572_65]|nr:MAG: hypothetical protein B6226_04210 [Candidatus Cloacimonetes bacterium 4572_65]
MKYNKRLNNKRYIVVNFMLFAILYLSVSFNKEVIRPIYGQTPIIGILTGSFSNFMAAFIISMFSFAPIFAKKIKFKKARIIVYVTALLVFSILTIEELKPFVSASTTYDIYDIIASGFGSILAILTFEIFIGKRVTIKNL